MVFYDHPAYFPNDLSPLYVCFIALKVIFQFSLLLPQSFRILCPFMTLLIPSRTISRFLFDIFVTSLSFNFMAWFILLFPSTF